MKSIDNKILLQAKTTKNDEFYTRYIDIAYKLRGFEPYLENKIIYLNCDSEKSNFYRYYRDNFERLKLKRLIASSYNKDGKGKIIDSKNNYKIEDLEENGSYNSKECIDILNKSDIIITNPPFSEITKGYYKLIKTKDYILLFPYISLTYKDISDDIINENSKIIDKVRYFVTSTNKKFNIQCFFISNINCIQRERRERTIDLKGNERVFNTIKDLNLSLFNNEFQKDDIILTTIDTIFKYQIYKKYFSFHQMISKEKLFKRVVLKYL